MRKGDVAKLVTEGGLNIFDFESIDGMLKLKWLQQFLLNRNSFWFYLPSDIFWKCGGIDFLLRWEFCISKLPIKLVIAFKKNCEVC